MRQNIEDSIIENCTFVGMGAPPSLFHFDFRKGSSKPISVDVPRKVRVMNAWVILQEESPEAGSIEIYNNDDKVTEMDTAGSKGMYIYPSSIDSEFWLFQRGSELRLVPIGDTQPAMTVYLMAHSV